MLYISLEKKNKNKKEIEKEKIKLPSFTKHTFG
jgi:hypothetical protein